MSTSVDNRIVEMKFNNSNFEKNIKQSKESLEKFKEALNLSSSADSVNKKLSSAISGVSFSSMESALERLSDRFSTLGVIGMTVLQNITNSAVNAAKSMISSITNAVVVGGRTRAQNIENAKFQLEGFNIAWKDIEEDINYGVAETAYGLDAAAMAASQLVASGVQFGETFGETGNSPMAKALRGISGLAAMTNRDYSEISRIFTTVAGNGRLMGQQLNEIGQRGVNGAMALVDFFNGVNDGSIIASESVERSIKELTHGLKITEPELRDFVSKGKVDFEMFSEAMDSAFGAHAKDANKTFQGVMSNIRAALAKIGADFWTPIIENESKMVEMLNSFKTLINDVKASIREALGWAENEEGIGYLMKWKNLVDEVFTTLNDKINKIDRNKLGKNIENIIKTIQYFGKSVLNIFDEISKITHSLGTAFKSVFNIKDSTNITGFIKGLAISFENFTKHIKINGDTIHNITNIFKGFFSIVDIGIQILSGVFGVIKDIVGAILPAGDGILALGGNVGQLLVKLDEFIKKNNIIKNFFQTISNVLTPVIEGIRTFATAVIEGFTNVTFGSSKAAEGFKNVTDKIKELSEKVRDFINRYMPKLTEGGFKLGEVFGKVGSVVGDILKRLGDFVSAIAPVIKSVLGGLLSLLDQVADVVIKILNNLDFSKLTANFASGGLFAMIGLGFKALVDSATSFSINIGKVLGTLSDKLAGLIGNNGTRANLIKSFAISIGILAAALVVLSSVDPDSLAAPLAVLTTTIAAFGVAVKALTPTFTSTTKLRGAITNLFDAFSFGIRLRETSNAFVKMAAAIFIIAGALRMLAELNAEQLLIGLAGLTAILFELVVMSEYISKKEITLAKGSAGLIAFGAGLILISQSVKSLAKLSWEGLAKGLVGLTGILVNIAGFATVISTTGANLITTGLAMIPLAAGIAILASSVKSLSELSWEQVAIGLTGLTGILLSIAGFAALMGLIASNLTLVALSMIPLAAGIAILASSVKSLAELSWGEVAIGLTGLTGILVSIAGFATIIAITGANLITVGLAMIPLAAGITILSNALISMSDLSWESLAKGLLGLVGALVSIAGLATVLATTGANLMTVGAGVLVFAVGMRVLLPVIQAFGSMSWGVIAAGIGTFIAVLATFGVAGAILGPLAKNMLLAAAGVAALGAACGIAGVGILSLAVGLTALGNSFGAVGTGVATLIKQILSIFPEIIKTIGSVINEIANVVANAIPAIVKAFVAIIQGISDAIIQSAPIIFDTILQLLDMLINYIPQIIDKVITIVIKIIDGVANRLPDLIQAVARFVQSFIDAVMDLFKDVTLEQFVNAIKDLSAAAAMLAIVGAMGASALAGLAVLMAIIVGLGALVAGLGWLQSQIPQLEELLTNGIPILEKIGYAIGSFIGNLVGGLLAGLSSALPEIADNLSAFMTHLQPFLDGARSIDPSVAKGAVTLAETILILTAASLLDGIASFFGADTSFAELGDQLVPFGESMKKFADSVAGLNADVVTNAANAGKAIAEMAATLPNSGGVAGFFAGENDMSIIGPQLEDFGIAMMGFATAVTGLDADVVTNAANAGKAIAEMAETLPNSGGVAGFFAGENDMSIIGPQLEDFGKSMKKFSNSVKGIDPEVVINAATAGKALAEMADTVPNSGGVVGFFAGENDIDTFGSKLVVFGRAMKAYSESVGDINPAAVVASAIAGQALASMADTVPNSGGVVGFFTGENDIDTFGLKLVVFGRAMKLYSDSVDGINPVAVIASAIAGQALTSLADTVPKTGGLISFFTGNKDIGKLGEQLVPFGIGMRAYSDSVDGMNAAAVIASAIAGLALATLAETVPSTGGLISFFTGRSDLGTFGTQLVIFGQALTAYSLSVAGMNTEAAWYSALIGMALTNLANTIPDSGGLFSVFGGDNDMATFGAQLGLFGNALVTFSNTVANTNFAAVDLAIDEINKIINCLSGVDGKVASAGQNFKTSLETMASTGVQGFVDKFNGAYSQISTAITTCFTNVVTLIQSYQTPIQTEGQNFGKGLSTGIQSQSSNIGNTVITIMKAILVYLALCEPSFKEEGQKFIQQMANGMTATISSVKTAMASIANAAKGAINISGSMYWVGVDAVNGFINGGYAQQYSVYWAYYSIGRLALAAAKQALDSNSPSKEFEKLGIDSDKGLANGLTKFAYVVESASNEVANAALDELRNSMSDISNVIEDSDFNPTIVPVLDLSEIQNGMGSLESLINGGTTSIGLAGSLSASSSGLMDRAYNDSNVVNAINSLQNRLDTVASRMENLQIILDSGELVGATAPGMNDQFGMMDILVQRGVM